MELVKEKPPRYQRSGMVGGDPDVCSSFIQVRKKDLMNAASAIMRVTQARNSPNLMDLRILISSSKAERPSKVI